jgi:large subunit ribosomal protein L17
MLSNMASSLILHKRITTTVAKAKALRTYVEPLITRSKEDTTHSRRTVFSYLQDKKAVSELFRDVSAKIMERPGGYTRILRTGFRKGDAAEMCIIELVDYNENMLTTKEAKKTTTRRSRRGGGKKAGAIASASVTAGEKTDKTTVAAAQVAEEATIVEEAAVVEEATVVEEVKAQVTEDIQAVEETITEAVEVVEAPETENEPPVAEENKE